MGAGSPTRKSSGVKLSMPSLQFVYLPISRRRLLDVDLLVGVQMICCAAHVPEVPNAKSDVACLMFLDDLMSSVSEETWRSMSLMRAVPVKPSVCG